DHGLSRARLEAGQQLAAGRAVVKRGVRLARQMSAEDDRIAPRAPGLQHLRQSRLGLGVVARAKQRTEKALLSPEEEQRRLTAGCRQQMRRQTQDGFLLE